MHREPPFYQAAPSKIGPDECTRGVDVMPGRRYSTTA
jgi:hypothetical protein